MTKTIATFTIHAYGIESVVTELKSGFSVVLHDTDVDEYVGMAFIYPTMDAAITKAKTLVL